MRLHEDFRIGWACLMVTAGCAVEPVAAPRRTTPEAFQVSTLADAGHGQEGVEGGLEAAYETAGEELIDAADTADTTDAGEQKAAVQEPYQEPLAPMDRRDAPARATARLSPRECRQRVRLNKLPVKTIGYARGVALPMRLEGPLHGVSFRGPDEKSKHSIMDCRLIVALEGMAEVLSKHGVTEVHFGNTYRPGARFRGKNGWRSSQHAHALAIDIDRLTLRDGTVLWVEHDYGGTLGEPSCGPEASMAEPTPRSVLFRNIVCDVARKGVFHHILTPNYDGAHRTHLHCHIERDGVWVTIR